MSAGFHAWMTRRTRLETLRCAQLRIEFDAGNGAGVLAMTKESSDELNAAVASGIAAQCRTCGGRGTIERVSMPDVKAIFLDPSVELGPLKMHRTTVECPGCNGRGLVAGKGCPCSSTTTS